VAVCRRRAVDDLTQANGEKNQSVGTLVGKRFERVCPCNSVCVVASESLVLGKSGVAVLLLSWIV
jgi:hypothetical protein